MRETDTHIYFWGSYLSNFWWAPFEAQIFFPDEENHFGARKVKFHTSEQYFMARKAMHFLDYDSLELILNAPDAKSAKALGKKIKGFNAEAWDKQSKSIMYDACFFKFSQNPNLRSKLVATNPKILVEASPLDKIWGVGLHEDNDLILNKDNWEGQNRLGEVLMMVRNVFLPKTLETSLFKETKRFNEANTD